MSLCANNVVSNNVSSPSVLNNYVISDNIDQIKLISNKIHKLKNENRTLASRRNHLIFEIKRSQNIYLKSCCEAIITGKGFYGLRDSSARMISSDLEKLIKISENIGRNGSKIERLRLLINKSGDMKYISNGKVGGLFITQEDMNKPLNELNKYSFYFIGEYTLRGDHIHVMYHNNRFSISNGYEVKLLSLRVQFSNLSEAVEWFSAVYDDVH